MSYYFDGSTSQAGSGATPILTSSTPFTVIAWVRPNDTAGDKVVWGSGLSTNPADYYILRVDDTELVEAVTRNSATASRVASSTSSISTSGWSMIHGIWNASNASRTAGYSAGNEGTESTSDTPTGTLDRTMVGYRLGPLSHFAGYIAVVAVYNKVLSGSELTTLLSDWPEDAASYADCVAHYNFLVNDADINRNRKNLGTYDLSLGGLTPPAYSSENPTLLTGSLVLPTYDACFRQNTLLRM